MANEGLRQRRKHTKDSPEDVDLEDRFAPPITPPLRVFSAYPRTSHCQEQSLLFKLPREIRDNIYAYYVHDENGVPYQLANDGSGCMLQSNKMPLNTSLKSTCSRVALEMKSLSIYTNTIHFFPGNKHSTHCAMLSDALRFKRLLEAVNAAKWHMLLLCRSMVRLPKIIDEAARVHSAPDFKDFFQALRDGLGEPMHAFRAGRWYSGHEKYSLASRSALQYALNLASKEPQFEELIREESTFPLRDPEAMMQHHSKFIRGVHSALLDWNPAPWSIPKDEDLFILESMLWNRDDVANLRRDNYADKIDWKFSACALAIDALQRLRPELRPALQNIVLHEDYPSVSNAESHSLGLIPFCIENPHLRLQRRVKAYYVAYFSRWAPTHLSWSFDDRGNWWNKDHDSMRHINAVVPWLAEARSLVSHAVPKSSYSLVFEDDGDRVAWAHLVDAAHMQEAMLASQRQRIALAPRRPSWTCIITCRGTSPIGSLKC